MRVYRIARQKWISDFRGSGRQARWNGPGERVLYTASSIALALLEILVHVTPDQLPEDYWWVSTDVADDMIEDLDDPRSDTRAIGSDWLNSGTSVALRVPSVIVPEPNVLLNPEHSEFSGIRWSEPAPLEIDPRLLRQSI